MIRVLVVGIAGVLVLVIAVALLVRSVAVGFGVAVLVVVAFGSFAVPLSESFDRWAHRRLYGGTRG